MKISDKDLIETYLKAIDTEGIDYDFIELLKQEIINRHLCVLK